MTRIVRTTPLCLLVGVIANAMVAWVCVLWSPLLLTIEDPMLSIEHPSWAVGPPAGVAAFLPPDWPGVPKQGRSVQTHGMEPFFGGCIESYAVSRDTHSPSWNEVIVETAGWPWRSLASNTVRAGQGILPSDMPVDEWRWGLTPPAFLRPERRSLGPPGAARPLPLLPMWPGFAANTLVYGATLWVLLAGVGRVRRGRRRRRGQCPACGYPVRGLAACPECGVAC